MSRCKIKYAKGLRLNGFMKIQHALILPSQPLLLCFSSIIYESRLTPARWRERSLALKTETSDLKHTLNNRNR